MSGPAVAMAGRERGWAAVHRSLRRSGALAVAAVSAGLLAGCGGGAAPRPAPSPSVTPPDYSLETAPPAPGSGQHPNQYEFGTPRVSNPWLPLEPGTRMRYVDRTARGTATEMVTVTRRTRVIAAVTTIVVRTTTSANGSPRQSGKGYFAQDVDGNVWLFGRQAESTSGAVLPGGWLAGTHGARPVVVMPATPHPGATYGAGEPAGWVRAGAGTGPAKVLRIGWVHQVPHGRSSRVLQVVRLDEPGARSYYAKGVGLALSQTGHARLELAKVTLFD